ncbi:MAG: tetratricopeptide repeat protein [bacterium]|nr:tetratricopeptide repeat protein [bacterium]
MRRFKTTSATRGIAWLRMPAAMLLLCLIGCAESDERQPRPELLAVPQPDLSAAESGVQEQIREKHAAIEAALANPAADAAELAELYGGLAPVFMIYDFLDAAEACFENARRLQPEDYRWTYFRGYLAKLQGRLPEAVELLQLTLELDPEFGPALVRLARTHIELGSIEEAGTLFERALELDPSSAAALEGLGKIAALEGDHAAAIERFERALELQPDASSLQYALGQSFRKLRDLEQAKIYLEKSGDLPVRVKDPLITPLAALGGSAQFYLTEAAEALSDGRFQEAAEFYLQALEYDPQDFSTYKAYCYSLEKLGDLEGAIEQLHVALRLGASGDPDRDRLEHAEIYRIMGGLQVLYGRDGQAIDSFTRSLELHPGMVDSRVKLGNALARNRRFAEAIGHFDKLLADRPDHAGILSKRAATLVNLGRGDEAVRDFRRAIANQPENVALRLRLAAALEFLGQTRAAAGERALAAEMTARAGDVQQRAQLLAQTARRQANQGDHQAAIASYREALQLAPDADESVDSRYRMALALEQLGQHVDALAEYRQVIEAESRHGPARRGEITILILLGRFGEARLKLNEALRLFPRDSQLAHTQARMLAAVPDPRVRDGEMALAVAQRLHKVNEGDPRIRETLAMAFAERGFFPQALQLQRRLIEEAESSGRSDLLPQLRAELAAYERREAWTFSSPEELLAVTMSGPAVR